MSLSLSALLTVGCSVGPDYEPPNVELPKEWQQSLHQPELPDDVTLEHYWTALNDPTLNELIEAALATNLTLQEATHRIEESLAAYGVQRAEYLPDIDLTASAQRRRRSEAVASAIAAPNNEILSMGGLLQWEIDILGRVRRLNESARANAEASIEAFHGVKVTLLSQLTSSYTLYRTLQTGITLTKQNIRTQQDSLNLAQDRFRAGVAPELDVRQAESNLFQTQAALPSLRISLSRQLHRIAVLTGGYPDSVRKQLASTAPLPEAPKLSTSKLPLNIVRQRPDLREAERLLASQHALIGAAEAELYPIVTLPGVFSFEALNTLEDAFQRDSLAYSIGPSVRLNLLDFGRVRGNIEVQDARTAQLQKRYEQQLLVAVQQVEDAIVSLQQERIRREHLTKSVQASKISSELVRSLYISGLTDFQNVLDSERRLFEQEISLANSSGNTVQAYIDLFTSLGGGWDQTNFTDNEEARPPK